MIFPQSANAQPRSSDGQSFGIFRGAEFLRGANAAFGLARNANERAEIRQCGVVHSHIRFWDEHRCIVPERCPACIRIDRHATIEESTQNASGIGFHDGHWLIEREGCYGVGGVFTDSRKLLHLLNRTRKAAATSVHDSRRGDVKISCASIVTKPLPGSKHVGVTTASECREVRKPAKPLIVIRDYSRDLGLLKHELRDNNAIRVASAAPGQVTTVAAIPVEQRAVERTKVLACYHDSQATLNVQHQTRNAE